MDGQSPSLPCASVSSLSSGNITCTVTAPSAAPGSSHLLPTEPGCLAHLPLILQELQSPWLATLPALGPSGSPSDLLQLGVLLGLHHAGDPKRARDGPGIPRWAAAQPSRSWSPTPLELLPTERREGTLFAQHPAQKPPPLNTSKRALGPDRDTWAE